MTYPITKTKKFRDIPLSEFPECYSSYTLSAQNYWSSHGIRKSYLKTLKTVYPTSRGICFALYGEPMFQERLCPPIDNLRYYYPSGGRLHNCVFLPDPDSKRDELILVEGTVDAVAVSQAGYRSCSVLGALVPDERIALIKRLIRDDKRVYYIPDNDPPGMQSVPKLIRELPFLRIRYIPSIHTVASSTSSQPKDVCDVPVYVRHTWLDDIMADKMK